MSAINLCRCRLPMPRMQAQDAASSPEANAAQLSKRLRDLVARLDSVLPYLNLAIATVALLNQGVCCSCSPSASCVSCSTPQPLVSTAPSLIRSRFYLLLCNWLAWSCVVHFLLLPV